MMHSNICVHKTFTVNTVHWKKFKLHRNILEYTYVYCQINLLINFNQSSWRLIYIYIYIYSQNKKYCIRISVDVLLPISVDVS